MNTIDILSVHDIIVRDHQKTSTSSGEFSDLTSLSMEKWKKLYHDISQNNTSEEVLSDVKSKFIQDEKKKLDNFNFYLIAVVPILDDFIQSKSVIIWFVLPVERSFPSRMIT